MSLANRLKGLQREVPEALPDLSEYTMDQLEGLTIEFGQKHRGCRFQDVWDSDQPWMTWFVGRYSNSKVLSHRLLIRFIEIKVERAEMLGETIPVREPLTDGTIPSAALPKAVNTPPGTLRPKNKAQPKPRVMAPPVVEEPDVEGFDLEMDSWSNVTQDQVQMLEQRMGDMEASLGTIMRALENIQMNQLTAQADGWNAP